MWTQFLSTFPPSSQFLSPGHVKLILTHSWLMLLLLLETLPFPRMTSWRLLFITENLLNSNATSTKQPLSATIPIKTATPFSHSIQYVNLGFLLLLLFLFKLLFVSSKQNMREHELLEEQDFVHPCSPALEIILGTQKPPPQQK